MQTAQGVTVSGEKKGKVMPTGLDGGDQGSEEPEMEMGEGQGTRSREGPPQQHRKELSCRQQSKY